jgi:hypothetical protein
MMKKGCFEEECTVAQLINVVFTAFKLPYKTSTIEKLRASLNKQFTKE